MEQRKVDLCFRSDPGLGQPGRELWSQRGPSGLSYHVGLKWPVFILPSCSVTVHGLPQEVHDLG